jgi:hypothetical protein
MYTQHFFIEGQPVGTASRKQTAIHGEMFAPRSYAYFCPCCGEVWARAPVSNGDWTAPWVVQNIECRKHGGESPFVVPGSMLLTWDNDFNTAAMSLEHVLKWEMNRHLDYMEKKA